MLAEVALVAKAAMVDAEAQVEMLARKTTARNVEEQTQAPKALLARRGHKALEVSMPIQARSALCSAARESEIVVISKAAYAASTLTFNFNWSA